MKTTLEPQALMKSPKDKTLLLQASTDNSHTQVPTQINWDDVNLPNRWLLKNVTNPIPVQNTLEDDIDYIDIITLTKKKLCHHQDVILTDSNCQKI